MSCRSVRDITEDYEQASITTASDGFSFSNGETSFSESRHTPGCYLCCKTCTLIYYYIYGNDSGVAIVSNYGSFVSTVIIIRL